MKSASRVELLISPLIPHRFIAKQLRQPSGPFGRLVMTRVLNRENAELINATVDALALTRSDAFMDLGFGGGLGLQLAAARTDGPLWGVDFSADVVLAASTTLRKTIADGRLNVICADVADLPLRDGLVQAICTTNTIYFWPDPLAALRSLRRVAGQGGRLALGFSGASKMRDYGKVTTHGFTLYEPERVEALMREAGFSQVQTLAQTGESSSG
ncbi:MAG TPA: methyltransferase domain-containing protein, partial [Polyangiales bacterium]|nr:methyltransferase domain-containing protein [Polyangiales bacterium]